MKRVLAIVLLCCYMLCAIGITLSFHHCRGELKYVNVHSEKEKKCCKGKKKMPKNCCKTVKVEFKKTEDKKPTVFTIKLKTGEPQKAITGHDNGSKNSAKQVYNIACASNFKLRPPPLLKGSVPLYVVNSVFRI